MAQSVKDLDLGLLLPLYSSVERRFNEHQFEWGRSKLSIVSGTYRRQTFA